MQTRFADADLVPRQLHGACAIPAEAPSVDFKERAIGIGMQDVSDLFQKTTREWLEEQKDGRRVTELDETTGSGPCLVCGWPACRIGRHQNLGTAGAQLICSQWK